MNWDNFVREAVKPLVPYAPGLRASEVRERSGAARISKLSSNESPYPPFDSALAAMHAVLPHMNRYPDGAAKALRRSLAEHLSVDQDLIVLGNGSNELLRVIAQTCLVPGDEVVFAWPSFIVYPMVTQLCGATAVRVPLADGDVHDLDAMLAAITERTKIVFLCNPNNPTGTIYDAARFERFLAAVPQSVLIVVDEAYFEYVTSPDYPDTLSAFDGQRPLAILRTFSKIYGLAGLRCGYGVVPLPLAEAMNKVREPFNVNTVAQIAAYYSLVDQAEVARRRAINESERDRLREALSSVGVTHAESQTNFVWIHTPRAQELFDGLLERGVIVRDFGGDALRLGIGTPEENDALISAVRSALGEAD